MKYPEIIKLKFLVPALILFLSISCDSPRATGPVRMPDISPEITIDEIRKAYEAGDYSVTELTQYYLDRIEALSFSGPELNAVITINPDAPKIAEQLDKEMQKGIIRGPLHGIPVLLKDNIDTHDKMPCTAGSLVMKESFPPEDSPLVNQLREAGAVILGKANLSEWANFHSFISSSGWSGLGGQTKNPYDLSRNPCGSSSGSAVAVSANLCVIAIGTETNGSIVCPSNNNGIVGIKPTVGLISRRGIIPISFTQDTGGPMARTVKDAAICLGTLTAVDSSDSKTLAAGRESYTDYTQFLELNGLEGKRLGYWKSPLNGEPRVTALMEDAISFFESQGATIVELDHVISSGASGYSFQVLLYEFKDGLNSYFSNMGSAAAVKSLEELIEKTFENENEMEYFDHGLLSMAQSKGDLKSEEYRESLEQIIKLSRTEGIDKVMDENDLDAIISPTGGPAWKTDLVNGDHFGISSSSPAAIAGYPNIVVPMGQIRGLPVGLSIFGRAWSEPVLLEIAFNYEQGTKKRITPEFVKGE